MSDRYQSLASSARELIDEMAASAQEITDFGRAVAGADTNPDKPEPFKVFPGTETVQSMLARLSEGALICYKLGYGWKNEESKQITATLTQIGQTHQLIFQQDPKRVVFASWYFVGICRGLGIFFEKTPPESELERQDRRQSLTRLMVQIAQLEKQIKRLEADNDDMFEIELHESLASLWDDFNKSLNAIDEKYDGSWTRDVRLLG